MVAVIEDKREAVISLCRKYGVVAMHVFGSALRDDFRSGESDIDLLMDGYAKAHAYFDMLDELEEVLGTKVDLVMVGALKNRYVAQDVEATKQVLYAA
jgi:predicted nucleotidyltransferase